MDSSSFLGPLMLEVVAQTLLAPAYTEESCLRDTELFKGKNKFPVLEAKPISSIECSIKMTACSFYYLIPYLVQLKFLSNFIQDEITSENKTNLEIYFKLKHKNRHCIAREWKGGLFKTLSCNCSLKKKPKGICTPPPPYEGQSAKVYDKTLIYMYKKFIMAISNIILYWEVLLTPPSPSFH